MPNVKSRKFRLSAIGALLACLTLLFCVSGLPGLRPDKVSAQSGPPRLRYDQIRQRFIHNAYSTTRDAFFDDGKFIVTGNLPGTKDEQLLDMMITHRVRALELDLHPSAYKGGFSCSDDRPATPDWFIYHDCYPDALPNVFRLSDALRQLRAFHEMQPLHEVVTINFEFGSQKGGKGNTSEFQHYSPRDLDNLIRQYLGDALFTPADLLAYNNLSPLTATLAQAVKPAANGGLSGVKGWPLTDEIRGKFIFIIHGAANSISTNPANNDLNIYFERGSSPNSVPACYNRSLAFENDEGDWRNLATLADANHSHMVFHGGISISNVSEGQILRRDIPGHILRANQIEDHAAQPENWLANFQNAVSSGVHFIYTDIADATVRVPGLRLHNNQLYPFAGNDVPAVFSTVSINDVLNHPSTVSKSETGSHLRFADISGGDIESSSDRFSYLWMNSSGGENDYVAELGSVSNHFVHPNGKAFIMARASLAPNAPNFSVGRRADRNGLRMQYRTVAGGGTATYEFDSPLFENENWPIVKLSVLPVGGGNVQYRAYASLKGINGPWQQIGPTVEFPASTPLPLIGLAACNNSGYDALNVYDYPNDRYSPLDFVGFQKNGFPVDLNTLTLAKIDHNTAPGVQRITNNDGLPRTTSVAITFHVPNPSLPGETVFVNLDLETNSGVKPTGFISITKNGQGAQLCNVQSFGFVAGRWTGSCQISMPAAGPYVLQATYNGDANYSASTSPIVPHLVKGRPTTTTIASSVNPSQINQPVTFTAQVTNPDVIPTGMVRFNIGNTTQPVDVLLVNGQASYTYTFAFGGLFPVKADYLGTTLFEPSSATPAGYQNVGCPLTTIGPPTLPNGVVMSPYSVTLTSNLAPSDRIFNLDGRYPWPDGLTINQQTGVISGIPTAVGVYDTGALVTPTAAGGGGAGCAAERRDTIIIACPSITLGALTDATPGTAYNQSVAASPAGGNYRYSVTYGALPAGLTLNTLTGMVTGTPTTNGLYTFAITATGFKGITGPANEVGVYPTTDGACGASRGYSLRIGPPCTPLTVNPASLPAGKAGEVYNQTLTATGGASPYNFTITAGALPNGMALTTAGILAGTPTAFGTFNFTVQTTENTGCTGTRAYTLTINPPCATITVNPASLPDGTLGAAYNQTVTATGSTAPYTFTISTGALPAGLSLAGSGAITGTPTATGTFNFTVKATDGSSCFGTRAYTVTVNGPVNNGLQFYPLSKPLRLLDT
ncbi:MAG TPA: putative Ig domain-containing protein, partial [Blastocatellia bacterium]|nr:putative Ig domain-containing protein [Blastocatellia bacterium]HMV87950.1 putative Ig domain-containing protein [Blastocatellia bacterium]HMY74094.1 putative Ig domain-containing protein [Blastocatellia bacterium]HMZ21910.1 putative Ig domain-containing protein [Blastocatellia bacterium]